LVGPVREIVHPAVLDEHVRVGLESVGHAVHVHAPRGVVRERDAGGDVAGQALDLGVLDEQAGVVVVEVTDRIVVAGDDATVANGDVVREHGDGAVDVEPFDDGTVLFDGDGTARPQHDTGRHAGVVGPGPRPAAHVT